MSQGDDVNEKGMPWWYDPDTVIEPGLILENDSDAGPLTPGGVPVSLIEAEKAAGVADDSA